MILILGVWIYNDIILRPIFKKVFPRLPREDPTQDGEKRNRENYHESYELPAPTKSTSSADAEKKEESMLSLDVEKIVRETRLKKNSVCGVGH